MDRISFSLVIPTYNEAKNIKIFFPQLLGIFQKWNTEFIFVDDGSDDGTVEYVREMMKAISDIKLIERGRLMGIGSALIDGYNAAEGTYIISCDSDLSYPAEDIKKIAGLLFSGGYDMVLGSRYRLRGSFYEAPNFGILKKKMISSFGNVFLRFATGIPVHDFSANCRGIRNSVWKRLFLSSRDNFMLFETIWRAHKKGFVIGEVPIRFFNRKFGSSKLDLAPALFRFVFQYLRLVVSPLTGIVFPFVKKNANKMQIALPAFADRWYGALFLVVLPIAVVFSPLLANLRFVGESTFSSYIGPYWYFLKHATGFHQSIFWDNYIFSGFPVFATVTGGFFSPVLYVMLRLFEPHLVYGYLTFLNVALGAFFTAIFLKKIGVSGVPALIAGLSFVFSQWIVVDYIYATNALPLLPLIFISILELNKKFRLSYFAFGSIIVALGWVSLHWQFLIFIFFGGTLFAAYLSFFNTEEFHGAVNRLVSIKARLNKFFSLILFEFAGSVLGFVQLVPSYIFLKLSERTVGFSHWAGTEGVSPFGILVSLFPRMVLPIINMNTGMFILAPALYFFIVGFSFRKKNGCSNFFSFLFILTVLLAINHSWLMYLLHHIPPFVFLHAPGRWMFLSSFSFAVLAGVGAQNVLDGGWQERRLRIAFLCFKWMALMFVFGSLIYSFVYILWGNGILRYLYYYFDTRLYGRSMGLPLSYYHGLIDAMFSQVTSSLYLFSKNFYVPLVFILLSFAFVRLYVKRKIGGAVFVNLGFLLAAANLVAVFSFPVDWLPVSLLENKPKTAAFLEQKNVGRIFSLFPGMSLFNRSLDIGRQATVEEYYRFSLEMLSANSNTRFGIESADADEPLTSVQMSRLLAYLGSYTFGAAGSEKLLEAKLPLLDKIKVFTARSHVINFLGIRYIISSYPLARFDKVFETAVTDNQFPVFIYENKNARPRYYFARGVEFTDQYVSPRTADVKLDGARNIFLQCGNDCPQSGVYDGSGDMQAFVDTNGLLRLETETSASQILVFSENNLPGWNVFVDGELSKMYTVGNVYMGVIVPPGKHAVSFEYSYVAIWPHLFDNWQ